MKEMTYDIKPDETIRCGIGEISVNNDGILIIRYAKDLDFVLDKAEEMVRISEKIANGNKMKVMIHTGMFGYMPEDTRKYLAKKSLANHRLAAALVIEWLSHRIMARFILFARKKYYPTSIFRNEKDALKWLKNIS
ncbi:MAG: hypothetical protein IT223_12345 [Crocinitomicaceae bacterium]|nr:hypothetical protein [Crocinitomicaceae bacterium]